ncbi:hypothetical protein [Paenibacillus tianjinensis]|uniref:Uncharacterized protein n=1 Tax=Paenibacillus tianjinensis TaxID=2810347 RepID=A0ABX7L9N1_9BACL|nr:hypothetical protein [Paenibacillus tianjinensis]QSF43744.1 hypothetical protein JRJ22_21140 [Paenibacillus tianjinensis]
MVRKRPVRLPANHLIAAQKDPPEQYPAGLLQRCLNPAESAVHTLGRHRLGSAKLNCRGLSTYGWNDDRREASLRMDHGRRCTVPVSMLRETTPETIVSAI